MFASFRLEALEINEKIHCKPLCIESMENKKIAPHI